MNFNQFLQEKDKGLKAPIYFLYAGEQYLLKEAALSAAETIPEAEKGFCLDTFNLDNDETLPFEQILDMLNTRPFMGSRRIVVVENIQELLKKDMQLLETYAANPSVCAVLLLLHKGSPAKGQFKDFIKKVRTVSLDMRPQDFPLWIKEKLQKNGLTITDGAIAYLLGLVGPDAGIISSELEKFALLGKSRIDTADIAGLVSGSGAYGVFDIGNAIEAKNSDKAFRIVRQLLETTEPFGLLGALNWHYTRKASTAKGKGEYYGRIFNILHEADLNIKSSGGNFPMEYLLIRLLQS